MTQQFVAELHKDQVPAVEVQMEPSSRVGRSGVGGATASLPGPFRGDQAKRDKALATFAGMVGAIVPEADVAAPT